MPRKKSDAVDAAPDKKARLAKIIDIITLKPTRTEDFAEELGVTARQVRRDINDLIIAGKIRRQGHKYQLLSQPVPDTKYTNRTPEALRVTKDEILELESAIEILSSSNMPTVTKHLSLMRNMKLKENPKLAKELGEKKSKTAESTYQGFGRDLAPIVAKLTEAIEAQDFLTIDYSDNKGIKKQRVIRPYRLFYADNNNQLYLCAWSKNGTKKFDKDNLHFYVVHRITEVKVANGRAETLLIKESDVQDCIDKQYGGFPCNGIYRVTLEVDPKLETYIKTYKFHKSQNIVSNGDTVTVRFEAGVNAPLVATLAKLGPLAYVAGPTELREAVIKHLDETKAAYKKKDTKKR